MFINAFPKFQRGRILKTEMLENLRDVPRDLWDIYLHGYSDGIVAGAELTAADNIVIIAKGIVKYQGRLYLLAKGARLPAPADGREALIKVKFDPPAEGGDFLIHAARIAIESDPLQCNELELGRFKLNEGAQLRWAYVDFLDFITEYNTINIVHAPYAGPGKSTISPSILDYFVNVVKKSGSSNPHDIYFTMQFLNDRIMARETILYYLANRLGLGFKDYTNLEIYHHLKTILKELQSGVKRNVEDSSRRPVRIIVD